MKRVGTILFAAAVFKSGETREALGRKLGCNQRTVGRMVTGERVPASYSLRVKIESLMHVPADSWDRWQE